jgi:hypothetical protein
MEKVRKSSHNKQAEREKERDKGEGGRQGRRGSEQLTSNCTARITV